MNNSEKHDRTELSILEKATWTPDPEALERFKNTHINDFNKDV